MKTALTIAGSDPGGGAGIQQDLKVFSSLKVYGTSVITAVTAQNTIGIRDVEPLSAKIVSKQIDAVAEDIRPDAVKTGMLVDSEIIRTVRKKVKEHRLKNLVVDPVMISTSGRRLLDEDAIEDLRKLMSVALVSTPNIYEAEVLSGIEIKSHRDMEAAAEQIGNCIVKGGHLDAVDILHYNGKFYRFEGRGKIDVKLHGAGCAFSAALTAYLARGMKVADAVKQAKKYVDGSIRRNFKPGAGASVLDTGNINGR